MLSVGIVQLTGYCVNKSLVFVSLTEETEGPQRDSLTEILFGSSHRPHNADLDLLVDLIYYFFFH